MKLLWCAFDLNRDCNRDCSFCCNRPFSGERFDNQKLNLAIAKIETVVSKYGIENISVPILGGEPLLHPDLPLKLMALLKKLNAKIDVWMYTNGDLLTKKIIKIYKNERIWITLSAAESPTDELIEKIKFLKKFYRIPRLSITLSQFNLLRLGDLVMKSIEVGFTIRFRNQYEPSDDLTRLYEERVPEAIRLYSSNPIITLRNLVYTYEDFWPCWQDEKSPYTCGKSFIHFDANGEMRACSGDVNSANLGTIFDEGDPIEKLRMAVLSGEAGRWSVKNISECQGCEFKTVCQGSCPLTRKNYYGDFNKPSPYCRGIKKTLPIFIELCMRKMEGSC